MQRNKCSAGQQRAPYEAPRAEELALTALPNIFASLSAEGGLGAYEDDGEL